jgi:predicted nucleic acid-binding protein
MIEAMKAALSGRLEVVMDASLAADALIGEPARKLLARRFLALCDGAGVRLSVPPIFASEADTTMRQSVRRGRLDAASLPLVFAALDALAVAVALDGAELQAVRIRAREIAALLDQPDVYDATYAALAERRGCDFWTADQRFANAANQSRRAPDGTTTPALPFVRFIGAFDLDTP